MTETRALVLEHQSARRRVLFGAVVTTTAPIAALLGLVLSGFHNLTPILVASLYVPLAGGIGLESLAVGGVRLRRAQKQLRALEPSLPEARLLT